MTLESFTNNGEVRIRIADVCVFNLHVAAGPDTQAIDVLKSLKRGLEDTKVERKEDFDKEIERLKKRHNDDVWRLDNVTRKIDEITANFDLVSGIHEK